MNDIKKTLITIIALSIVIGVLFGFAFGMKLQYNHDNNFLKNMSEINETFMIDNDCCYKIQKLIITEDDINFLIYNSSNEE